MDFDFWTVSSPFPSLKQVTLVPPNTQFYYFEGSSAYWTYTVLHIYIHKEGYTCSTENDYQYTSNNLTVHDVIKQNELGTLDLFSASSMIILTHFRGLKLS